MKRFTLILFILIVMSLLFQFCKDPGEEIVPIDEVTIINDEEKLNARMKLGETEIPIVDSDGRLSKEFKLILQGELEPPTINGSMLQATSAANFKGAIIVSYNFSGPTYLGALDYINSSLKVKSEIIFPDADINHVTVDGSNVFFVGSKDGQDVPAFVEKVSVRNSNFRLDDIASNLLGSYAANSVYTDEKYLYISTGDDENNGGGIYKVSFNLDIIDFMPMHDSRWITESNATMYVAQGTPGKVSFINSNSLQVNSSFDFKGALVPEAKTTIDVNDDLIFVAGGDQGVLIFDTNGNLRSEIKFNDKDAITNAVAADDGLLFISNGEAGIYVASYDKKKSSVESNLLGKLDFGKHISVNHVYYRGSRLYIAAGLGGVKLVKVNK